VDVENRGEFTSGMTVADDRPTRLFKNKARQTTGVCYKVDAPRFEQLFQRRVLGG
jgi:inosine-uridine nucleoside N-ribohydrolase